jgi:hypothetical protein
MFLTGILFKGEAGPAYCFYTGAEILQNTGRLRLSKVRQVTHRNALINRQILWAKNS